MKEVVDAITDLTRVLIALSGKFASKADAVRGLYALSITPTRIAHILNMESKAVHTEISRAKKASGSKARKEGK